MRESSKKETHKTAGAIVRASSISGGIGQRSRGQVGSITTRIGR